MCSERYIQILMITLTGIRSCHVRLSDGLYMASNLLAMRRIYLVVFFLYKLFNWYKGIQLKDMNEWNDYLIKFWQWTSIRRIWCQFLVLDFGNLFLYMKENSDSTKILAAPKIRIHLNRSIRNGLIPGSSQEVAPHQSFVYGINLRDKKEDFSGAWPLS